LNARPVHSWAAAALRPLRALLAAALLLPAGPALAQNAKAQPFEIGPVPGWVEPLAPEHAAEAPADQVADQVAGGVHYLLLDQQVRLDGTRRATYQHVAAKALNERGVESIANIEVRFDPSYQRLILHAITVRRGARALQKLSRAAVRVLQRETDLEALIFDGSMTANVFLDDVRVGDVVEYAYSVVGHNPVFGDRHFGRFSMQWSVPVARARARLLWPQGRALHLQHHNEAAAPAVTQGATHVDHRWDLRQVAARRVENDAPAWFDPYPSVQWSEFADWQAVVQWALPLYRLPMRAVPAVEAEAARLAPPGTVPSERLVAALRFVQREVRYLGIEAGAGSHQPSAPQLVLERRFGDCKDKTLLTVALLRAMGIEAHPALVNTAARRGIESWQPSPGAFNHVVVRARLDGRDFWFDPTRSTQEGSLFNLSQADYGPALVVDAGTDALVPMAGEQALRQVREVRAVLDSSAGMDQPVKYTVTTVVQGVAADVLRATLAQQSREQLQKNYVNFYAGYFAGVAPAAPLQVDDDPTANEITLTERYVIDRFWQRSDERKRLEASIEVPELAEYMRVPQAQVRQSPLALMHPLEFTHVTEVRLPRRWDIKPDRQHIDDPAFEFRREESWTAGRTLVLTDRFTSRLDHVAAGDVERYAGNVEKARRAARYELYLHDRSAAPAAAEGPHWLPAVASTLALLAALAVAVRVHRWDPEPWPLDSQPYPVPPQGLGGWLALLGLSMALSIWRIARELADAATSYTATAWLSLTTAGEAAYHPLWAPALLFSMAGAIASLTACGLFLLLYLQRRSSAPRVFIATVLGSAVFATADLALVALIPAARAEAGASAWGQLAWRWIAAAVWVAYMLKSRRVRATFVRRRGPQPQAPLPALTAASP
jgi:transglutaminase-like putative cysteine protease